MNAALSRDRTSRVRFGVEHYLRLDDAGILNGVGRTELIDGDIIVMNAVHRPHSRARLRLTRLIEDALVAIRSPLGVLDEATVGMPPHDAPLPDITVSSEPDGEGVVPLASVALLVEIADSTLDYDLGQKAALYARQGIPEYWVVDLRGGRIVVLSQPNTDTFATTVIVPIGKPVTSATVAGLTVATTDLSRYSRSNRT